VREGRWRQPVTGFNTFEVAGKTLGLVGAGNIGRKVARRLAAFECSVVYYDVVPAPDIEKDLGARRVSLDELLREADIITLHLPLMRETRGLIGRQQLGMMKPTTVLLNTSRGEIVDEGALIEALREGRIAGAGLDVFGKEPIAPDNPLLQLDNVVLSPHTAGHAYEGWFRRSRFAWENIQRVAAGQAPLSVARPEDA
jgi:phosphoglycerate dehydrogenase-like enzyme